VPDAAELRIALSEDLGFAPLDDDVRAAFRVTVDLLDAAGATLVEDSPGLASSVRACGDRRRARRSVLA
jgi:hypothetical protein